MLYVIESPIAARPIYSESTIPFHVYDHSLPREFTCDDQSNEIENEYPDTGQQEPTHDLLWR